ncbi:MULTISPECIES: Imm1 family immunity protein [unclassified Amycolatopsis]|uniref:Imm1 family immunity protein n=1 Tax=unclassified Amycolatopsis TaxID=2618356 RepID=UPI002E216D5A|nr:MULTISPECIES: Imm1 family immunity protein [unclassified Amycolatopsis]
MAVTAYYTREGASLTGPAEADELLTRMAEDRKPGELPRMAALEHEESGAVLEAGINGERGFVTHISQTGRSALSTNGSTSREVIEYDEQAHVREVPAHAEIPVGQVREAVRRFVSSGGARPDNVSWSDV